ncbi:transcriptional regulator [Bacillus pseudomycoides]|uniref:Transcriptional regulator n=4 Tax=Bacillus TaxID=1386 RepID=A0AA91V7A4_9BACI|nr:transcriptional regulator [Bacillus sp. AFS098217]PED79922.1 transcriptional regulator [Bacillus pseudomycoides]PEU08689.1 transcriptional regulator [Bacillus sp. AFS019443]PFW56013.1 transcriptional regulator [Bacillus sp. AFS075034]
MNYTLKSNNMGKGSFCIEMEMRQLQDKIEDQKQELSVLVAKYGLAHDKVVLFSRDLDILINRFMNEQKNDVTLCGQLTR